MPERPTAENCIVHHDGGADGQVVAVLRWAVEAVLDEQLVEGVGVDASVDSQHFSRRG
jgi:hypothetical protein